MSWSANIACLPALSWGPSHHLLLHSTERCGPDVQPQILPSVHNSVASQWEMYAQLSATVGANGMAASSCLRGGRDFTSLALVYC